MAVSLSVVLVPAHVTGPAESDTVRAATLIIAVLGGWIGVLRIAAHRWTAACVAGSSTLVALGDVSSGVLSAVRWTVAGFSLSDLAFLLAYLVMWLGLRRLLPRGSRRSRAARLDGVIDGGAVLVVLAYVEWELAVATVGREGLSPSIVTVWMLYPFLDAALLALTVRIWASRRYGDAGLAFVALGLFCWFAADLGYLRASRWQRDHPTAGGLTMAVNASGSQLGGEGFTEAVAQVLADTGLRPASLVLELTETALVHDPVEAAAQMQSLRELGVRLAIDDFGTGYSSLSYLRSFPVDILKVDRTFVAMITEHEAVPPILRGLIELARTLGLELVAEGVETETQHELLKAERCDLAQGYLYAAPLDMEEAEAQILALVPASAAGAS